VHTVDRFDSEEWFSCDQVIFYKSSAVAEMGDRLATIDMGRKVGRGCWLS